MSRTAGAIVPKYSKHKASGQAVVTIGGVDHYLGPHGTKASLLEYDRLIGEWITAGRPSSVATSSDITIADRQRHGSVHDALRIVVPVPASTSRGSC
jgi:hypothetical protein